MNYYNIFLPIPNNSILTYYYEAILEKGNRVIVPLRNREEFGIVLDKVDPEKNINYKNIIEKVDDFKVGDDFLNLIFSIGKYYCNDVGLVFHNAISKKLFFSKAELEFDENFFVEKQEVLLTTQQEEIFESIKNSGLNGFTVHYIHGVTGSGKTEIYAKLIEDIVLAGKQVLYLLPEIALTSHLPARIEKRIGQKVGIFHSKLPSKKRKTVFWQFVANKLKVVVGTRSALFIPAANIGLIIVDEEHERTLKQDESPFFHLRDMAVLYAKQLDIPIILGSATPSVESFYNCKSGKYKYYQLTGRYSTAKIPEIKIVKMDKDNLVGGIFSERMCESIAEKIKRNEQTILFINKKGYYHNIVCASCGTFLTCPNCSVGLTYFSKRGSFFCHYCGESYKRIVCPDCKSDDFFYYGYGIEQVEKIAREIFGVDVIKLDTDEITSFTKLNNKLEEFEKNKTPIMVGTQIIAKGFDFKNVTLVGILDIDRLLSLPDFRSFERCYQLINQVGGRAGRFEKEGEVLIQTFNPENPFFNLINDSEKFYDYELARREAFGYPPFTRMCRLILEHSNKERCEEIAFSIAHYLKNKTDMEVLGPSPPVVFKIKNRFRFHILLKSEKISHIHHACRLAKKKFDELKKGNILLKIDVDPYNFM